MRQFAVYQGKVVQYKAIEREDYDRLVRDARRILGLEMDKRWLYLTPPDPGSMEGQYANHVLAVKFPASYIWLGYYYLVSNSDLIPLEVNDHQNLQRPPNRRPNRRR